MRRDRAAVNLAGINYHVLANTDAIERYVLAVAAEEWDPEDFEEFGVDLFGQTWTLEQVDVERIKPQQALLASPEFQADVQPRIARQRALHAIGGAVPPLILRAADLLIFDGYARWHYFRERGITQCLAYVGRPAA